MKTLLAAVLGFSSLAYASPPAEWINGPGATAEYVEERVFGGRVALYRAGPRDGETVVLLHGLGKPAARDWTYVIPALARHHDVIALDLPGFGHSDKGNHHYTPENFARALAGVVEKAAHGRVTLVGHSMGGAIALAYAAAYPDRVSRLVLVDTAGILHRSVYVEFLARTAVQRALGVDSPWYGPLTRAIERRAENWPLHDEIALERAGVRQRILGGDPTAISAFAMTGTDFGRALRAIRAPTLVIWGAEDRIAPLRTGQALASAIPGARLVVLEGAGHAPQVGTPERFNAVLLDELDELPLAAPPYALAAEPVRGNRVEKCQGRRGEEFSGDYATLVLENCREARISNARIGRLHALHSSASIVNSYIRDGVVAKQSRLQLTGGRVGAPLALDATSVDAAATRFESGAIAANSGEVPVTLRLSIAQATRSAALLHDIFRIAPGETLIR
jgi:pimeloyl-ACP methyl ester carboxylesterase